MRFSHLGIEFSKENKHSIVNFIYNKEKVLNKEEICSKHLITNGCCVWR
jgi:uncharacterized ubiquitin-like protein YukD